jgi:ATP-binding cassette subfamily F protein uup
MSDMVLSLKGVEKVFGAFRALGPVDLDITPGERLGIIGPNGSGKTTLLRLILGELEPTSGRVRRGTSLQVAYYDQMREVLDPEATLRDTISPGSDTVEIGGTKKHVISYLEDFLFDPVRARSPVKSLSGGERNRLLLARLFARPANVLVLDEPTNDLDIDTLELLEELLLDYPGTLFLVSHDRAFLDNVVTQVIAFEGDGVLREYPGGYTDWQRAQERMRALRVADERETAAVEARKAAQARKPATAHEPSGAALPTLAKKLSFRERQELDALPARIEELETTVARLQAELADPALYQRDPDRARNVGHELKTAEEAVTNAYARWEALEARR